MPETLLSPYETAVQDVPYCSVCENTGLITLTIRPYRHKGRWFLDFTHEGWFTTRCSCAWGDARRLSACVARPAAEVLGREPQEQLITVPVPF